MGTLVQLCFPLMDVEMTTWKRWLSQRYQTGVTTREISDIIERMYGHHYSPATISNISKATQENVAAFHERSLEAN